MHRLITITATVFALALGAAGAAAGDDIPYDGRKKCSGCHKSQYLSWKETAHGKALESLAPGAKTEAKKKAGLDPAKDYAKEAACLACHTTGFGADGGYDPDYPSPYVEGVGCESCHGPGSEYRRVHRAAAKSFERKGKATPRSELADAGQEFAFVERCMSCHLNYEGSSWKGAKEPFTPFTPKVDPKYAFDFDRAVRDNHAMHEHFKLDGAFAGDPVADFHAAFQAAAKPIAAD